MGNFQFNDNIDEDTAFSGVHATAQRTGLQLKTMNRALFQGVLQYNFLTAGHNSMKPPLCVSKHLQHSQQTLRIGDNGADHLTKILLFDRNMCVGQFLK